MNVVSIAYLVMGFIGLYLWSEKSEPKRPLLIRVVIAFICSPFWLPILVVYWFNEYATNKKKVEVLQKEVEKLKKKK